MDYFVQPWGFTSNGTTEQASAANQSSDNQNNSSSSSDNQTSDNNANSDAKAAKVTSAAASDSETQTVTTTKSTAVTAAGLSESKAASENIAPIAYTEDEGATANVASTLTNADAVKFLKNGQALLDAGATIAWDGTPDTGNQADYVNGEIADGSGKIKVTYKDGTSKTVDVTFMLNAQVGLRQAANGTKSYYYVKNVGDKVTSMDTPDSNGYVLYDPNDASHPNDPHGLIGFGQSLTGQGATPQITAKLTKPLDTSTIGIHWADVEVNDTTSTGVTDGFSNTVGTYTIKVPYIVKGLKLSDNIPKEADGTPVINAQRLSYETGTKATDINNNGPEQIGFELTNSAGVYNPTATLGQYFYQDFALAYSLGVTTTVSDWTTPTVEQVKTMATNHFTLNLAGLSNADKQAVKVKYVDRPTLEDLYFFNQGKDAAYSTDYMANQKFLKGEMLTSGYLNDHYQAVTDGFKSTAITMTAHPSWLSSIADGSGRPVGRTRGRWNIIVNAVFGGLNSVGQPEIFSTQNFNIINSGYGTTGIAGSPEFAKEVADATTKYFANAGTGSTTTINPYGSTIYYAFKPQAIALYQPSLDKLGTVDITDAPDVVEKDLTEIVLKHLKNPKPATEDKTNGKPNANPILDNNTTWPAGTTVTFLDKDNKPIKNAGFIKAGQQFIGSIKVTLPSGSSVTFKSDSSNASSLHAIARAKGQDKTTPVGTALTAKELISNTNKFPDTATYEFVNGTEPDWNKSGDYSQVQVQVTYPMAGGNGNRTTTATMNVKVVASMDMTVQFVDTNDNNKVVGTATESGQIGSTITDFKNVQNAWTTLQNKGYGLADGAELPTSYKFTDQKDQVITINLVHRTQDVSDTDTQAKETRHLTVNYTAAADGGNYKQGNAVADASVLDVYYKRTATKDLVTGTVTYGNWQWDTSQGENGYHVVSGDWGHLDANGNWAAGLPSSWAAVVAKVPTVSGFVTFAQGDWETNKKGGVSTTPANQFVFPTYNGTMTTVDGSNSIAYTSDSPVYEGTATHTVYYVPIQEEGRVVTEHFKIYQEDGTFTDADVVNLPDGTKQSFAQAKVWYQRTPKVFATNGSTDPAKWQITYNGWGWNQTAGSKETPGYTIISGGYTHAGKVIGQGLWNWSYDNLQGSWGISIPSLNGYTAANLKTDLGNSTNTFGSPKDSGNGFVNDTDPTWYWRNSLTTFYVPNSLLNKTVTRTIKIHNPGTDAVTTIPQPVTFTRTARVNKGTNTAGDYGDTEIVFGALTDNNAYNFTAGNNIWNHKSGQTNASDTWPKWTQNIVKPGYTAQINGQDVTSVPAATVTPDSKDTTVDVYYTAIATAKLTGNGSATYTGKPITTADLNNPTTGLKITVTGPTANAGSLALNAGDVEFSTDGTHWTQTLPTNADTYQVRLTTQGENAIRSKYGNTNIVWTQDGKSTITSDATFTINPLKDNAVLANTGDYGKVYDGSATTAIDPTKFGFTTTVDGNSVNLDTTGLTASDFTWVDAAGNAIAAPQNVGTYHIKLTEDGLATLQAHNKNFKLTESGLGTYTITQAQASATLSGAGTRAYNGQAVSVDDLNAHGDNNTITLTLHYPKDGNANYSTTVKLTADDFVWNTPDGQAPVDANSQAYTISLKPDAIKAIIENAVGTGQDGKSNVVFADDAISGSASYTITPLESNATISSVDGYGKTYDAQVTNQIDPAKLQIKAGDTVLNTNGLTGSDYEWVDADGNALTEGNYPKNVGTYYIQLKQSGIDKLKADNPNYTLTMSDNKGQYVISQAQGSAVLSGTNAKTYDGTDVTLAELNSNGQIVVKLTFPGSNDATYTLQAGDYTLDQNGATVTDPTNAGTYTIVLTTAGKTNIAKKVQELSGKGQNEQANATVDPSAISVKNAEFTIKPSANVVNVSGTQTEDYTGSPINVVYNANGTNSVTVSFTKPAGNTTGATAPISSVILESGDFKIVDAQGNLTTAKKAGGTYHIVLTDDGVAKVQAAVGNNYKITQGTSFGNLVINKYTASAEFKGDPTITYTGKADANYLSGFSITLNEPNHPVYQLVAGDIEFKVNGTWTTQVPVNVGNYEVRLSQDGWDHVKAINANNVTWSATASAGTGTYTINAATATTELSGQNSMVYNGQAVTTGDLYSQGSTIKVTINGDNITNLPTSFTLADGDYTWNTSDGSAPTAVGNYTITLTEQGLNKIQSAIDQAVGAGNVTLTRTNTGSAAFDIKQAVSPNVQLHGQEKSEYNGQAVKFDPTNAEIKQNFGFNNVEGLTIPDLTSDDFEWVDKDGNSIAAPTNVGTYYLQLNNNGRRAIANANPNYSFTNQDGSSTITGRITYQIFPANLEVGISGTASKVYNGKNAAVTQQQIDNGDIKLVWGNDSSTEPVGLGQFTLTAADLEVVDADGNPVMHANAHGNEQTGSPVYYVRLTAAAIAKIKALTGANNYAISQVSDAQSGRYLIYAHKAQLTLTGNQTTTYGTTLPLDATKYTAELTNWNDATTLKPTIGALQAGDVYIVGYATDDGMPNGQLPTNAGSYQVRISTQLLNRLKAEFPDYDFDGVGELATVSLLAVNDPDGNIIEAAHDNASYVINPAQTTVTINGAEHITYGQEPTIKYGDNGYTMTITAPVHNGTVDNNKQPIYTNVHLTAGDLQFVTEPGDVGSYEVQLSQQGLDKLYTLTGSTNYNWEQAPKARGNFYVDQLAVKVVISGDQHVTYGTPEWQTALTTVPSGYLIEIQDNNGEVIDEYQPVDGDLAYVANPGNAGTYDVVLTKDGLSHIEAQEGTTNYAYPQTAKDTTSTATLTVDKGNAQVNVNGSWEKNYGNPQVWPAANQLGEHYRLGGLTIYKADGTTVTVDLQPSDLAFAGGQTPTNVGTYNVVLSENGKQRIKALDGNNGNNYNWSYEPTAVYTIDQVIGKAALDGANSKVYDGQPVTTAQVNKDGKIVVNLTVPVYSTPDAPGEQPTLINTIHLGTYTLQDGDYTWADGSAPTKVGTYTINLNKDSILNHLQARINELAGTGKDSDGNVQDNVVISANDLSGQATFNITPKDITNVTISGDAQSKTYDGQGASLNVGGLTISGTGTLNGTTLSDTGIKASDFDWYDANGTKLNEVPVNAGQYEARLTDRALTALRNANPNYNFTAVNGTVKYTINPKAATDTLGNNGEKTYNGKGTSVDDVLSKLTWTPSGLVEGQSLKTSDLTANDYEWYTKNSDGTYTAMTGLPTNVGTYYLKLKAGSIDKIKNANPNYSFADGAIGGEFTYTINQATGSATLAGQNHRTYNGSVVTIDDINSTDGNIEVTFDFPGNNNSVYKLKAGEYDWYKDGNKLTDAPTAAGTYTIKLDPDKLQDIINSIAGNGNVKIDGETGSATFTVDKKDLTVTLGDKDSSKPAGKTYDGQAATLNHILQMVW